MKFDAKVRRGGEILREEESLKEIGGSTRNKKKEERKLGTEGTEDTDVWAMPRCLFDAGQLQGTGGAWKVGERLKSWTLWERNAGVMV